MNVFFVRHGQSVGNVEHRHQSQTTKLTHLGIRQAQILAQRFTKIKIDLIISSSMQRTRQTAKIINQVVKKPIFYTPLLREIKKPTVIENQKEDDLVVVKIKTLIRNNLDDLNYHYSDEENFSDLRRRAQKLLAYLINLKKDNLLVITHAEFLRFIIGYLLWEENFTPQQFFRLLEFFQSQNTAITLCQYTAAHQWQLVTWNDHTHLAE